MYWYTLLEMWCDSQMSDCSPGQIKGISSLKSTLATLTVHSSASSMKVWNLYHMHSHRPDCTSETIGLYIILSSCVGNFSPRSSRIGSVGAWRRRRRMSRNRHHSNLEDVDHSGHESQWDLLYRRVCGEERLHTFSCAMLFYIILYIHYTSRSSWNRYLTKEDGHMITFNWLVLFIWALKASVHDPVPSKAFEFWSIRWAIQSVILSNNNNNKI